MPNDSVKLVAALMAAAVTGTACPDEEDRSGGKHVVEGITATETEDPVFGVVAVHDDGEKLAAMTRRDETGNIVGVTGAVWISADGEQSSVIQLEDGLPARAVIGDAVAFFRNYTSDTVDVSLALPDGSVHVSRGVKINADDISALRNIDAISSRGSSLRRSALFGSKLSLLKAVKIAGIAAGIASCAVGAAAATVATGGTAAVLAAGATLACTGALTKIASELLPENDTLKTVNAAVEGAACGLGHCLGVGFALLEEQVQHAEQASDEAVAQAGTDLDENWCRPFCDGKQCGDDGCGGSCGDCPVGGQCERTTGLCRQSESSDAGVSSSDSGSTPVAPGDCGQAEICETGELALNGSSPDDGDPLASGGWMPNGGRAESLTYSSAEAHSGRLSMRLYGNNGAGANASFGRTTSSFTATIWYRAESAAADQFSVGSADGDIGILTGGFCGLDVPFAFRFSDPSGRSGSREPIPGAPAYRSNTWYQFRIEVAGQDISVSVSDGTTVGSANFMMDTRLAYDRVKLTLDCCGGCNHAAYWDDFTVDFR